MAPKSSVLDSTCHAKCPLSARGCACNPSATRYKVSAWAHWLTTIDISMRRGDMIRCPLMSRATISEAPPTEQPPPSLQAALCPCHKEVSSYGVASYSQVQLGH